MPAPTTSAATTPVIPSTPARIAERPGTARVPRPRSSAIREPITAGTGIRHRVTADRMRVLRSVARGRVGSQAARRVPHHAATTVTSTVSRRSTTKPSPSTAPSIANPGAGSIERAAPMGIQRDPTIARATAPTEPPTTAGSIGSADRECALGVAVAERQLDGLLGTGRPGPPGHQHDQGREGSEPTEHGEEREPDGEDRERVVDPARVEAARVERRVVAARDATEGRGELVLGAGREPDAEQAGVREDLVVVGAPDRRTQEHDAGLLALGGEIPHAPVDPHDVQVQSRSARGHRLSGTQRVELVVGEGCDVDLVPDAEAEAVGDVRREHDLVGRARPAARDDDGAIGGPTEPIVDRGDDGRLLARRRDHE